MSSEDDVNVWTLGDLSTPWCVHVVSTLRVAERIESGVTRNRASGGRAPAPIVTRFIACSGISSRRDSSTSRRPATFALNEPARALLDPGVQLVFDLESFGGRMAYAWCGLFETVRAGTPAYDKVFGQPFWQDLQANPEIAAKFDALDGARRPRHAGPRGVAVGRLGQAFGRSSMSAAARARFSPRSCARIRTSAARWSICPGRSSRSRDLLEAAGVADRVTTSAQSFFDPLPAGADLYLLKNVLADWPDAEASALLTRCAEAARPSGR